MRIKDCRQKGLGERGGMLKGSSYNLAYGRPYLLSNMSEQIKIMLGGVTREETMLSVRFVQ